MRVILLAAMCLVSLATTSGAQAARRLQSSFAEYEGVYAYHGSTTLAIVAGDTIIFAVIDEAKYPLRSMGGDKFLNGVGDTIPFRRGADGAVSGFSERGVFFARRSAKLDVALVEAVRAVPRRIGADGRPIAYAYVAPAKLADGLRVGDLSGAGLDTPTVTRLVNRVVDGTYPDVHSILVYRGGKLVVEEYFYGYDRGRVHQMRSASKSVVSALVGIAIDRKLLAGDSDRVMNYLPYSRYANPDPRKDRLTIRDLLTMRSGLACDDWNQASPGNESRIYQTNDWVKSVLDLPLVDDPDTKASYCSGNVMVAGRIVERASGKSLPAFAQETLFGPLGVRPRDVRWNFTLNASNASTFAQLYLRPRDMLKLGALFQQQGVWNGRQVISKDWVARSVAKWSTVGDQEYGYFWWHQWTNAQTANGPRRVDMVVATGNGGQKIYIVPSLDLIVVLTGGNFNAASPSMTIMAKDLLPPLLAGTK